MSSMTLELMFLIKLRRYDQIPHIDDDILICRNDKYRLQFYCNYHNILQSIHISENLQASKKFAYVLMLYIYIYIYIYKLYLLAHYKDKPRIIYQDNKLYFMSRR